MKDSWLVQRLNAPAGGRMGAISEAFSFGGGRRNGGLSDDAMSLLRSVFSFDYMGSAEFEWGAVPDALNSIAKNARKYRPFEIEVAGRPVYLICATDDADEVRARVEAWAADRYVGGLKEQTYLHDALHNDEWARALGWLELDNGFFVFIDREMFELTAAMFGVKVAA